MRYLLLLPNAVSFFIVAILAGGMASLGLYLVRWKFSAQELRENHDVAFAIFGAFGWLYAVVVAFVVFVTWTGYDDANKNLQLEASRALDIFYSAETFPEPLKGMCRASSSVTWITSSGMNCRSWPKTARSYTRPRCCEK